MTQLIVRDLALGVATVLAWRLGSHATAGTGPASDLLGLLLGLLFGLCAIQVHEWSHFVAGALAGARIQGLGDLRSPFVFRFDRGENTAGQFVAMSIGGLAASALLVWLAYTALPGDLQATRVARGTVLMLAGAGVALELPALTRVLIDTRHDLDRTGMPRPDRDQSTRTIVSI